MTYLNAQRMWKKAFIKMTLDLVIQTAKDEPITEISESL